MLKSNTQKEIINSEAANRQALDLLKRDNAKKPSKYFFATTKEDLAEKLRHLPQQRAILNGNNQAPINQLVLLRKHS